MTEKLETRRRRLLGTVGTLTALGLAGCVGSAPNAVGGGGQPPDTTAAEDDHEEGDGHHEDGSHNEEEDGHHEEEIHHEETSPHQGGGHGSEGPRSHVEVAMQSTADGEHFHPHVAWVEVGGTVTFVNESGMHSATAYHPDNDKPLRVPQGAEAFDSGLLTEEGATFEHTFEVEGVYDVYCAPHEELGMIGSVVVGRPDPHGQPGLAEPGEEMSETVAEKLSSLNDQVDTMLGHEH